MFGCQFSSFKMQYLVIMKNIVSTILIETIKISKYFAQHRNFHHFLSRKYFRIVEVIVVYWTLFLQAKIKLLCTNYSPLCSVMLLCSVTLEIKSGLYIVFRISLSVFEKEMSYYNNNAIFVNLQIFIKINTLGFASGKIRTSGLLMKNRQL